MGTEISLDIGGLSIDWSKNSRGDDHGPLFQEGDRKPIRSDQINHEGFAGNSEDDPDPTEMALVRSLKDVVPRIELMGFTREIAKAQYLDAVESCRQEREDIDERGAQASDLMSFDEFSFFVSAHPVQELDNTFIGSDDERKIRGRFSDECITNRIPHSVLDCSSAYSERSYFGSLINILHPYALLRVLAESPDNLQADVVWQYGPLVDAGWAGESEFKTGARRNQTFLIATEGSSDVHILNSFAAVSGFLSLSLMSSIRKTIGEGE